MNSSISKDYDYLFKLVLIGDSGVGKSCLLLRFADDSFTDSYITTIGVDFRFRTVIVNNKRIKLQIWDTAGQERFRTITSTYYRGADGIIMVYDVTDKASFEHINDWLNEVNKYASEDTCKLLLGNKCDIEDNRDVASTDVERLSEVIEVPAMEVSAKTGHNIDKAFLSITEKLVNLKMQKEPVDSEVKTVSLNTYNDYMQRVKSMRCCPL
ncbi:Rab GTPase [Theileria orientalis strain Shintoku]|uniref:Rab GTPase n=1 Tax=Theileria orientalis strain Shintoku TaxID=869250 RepID=J4CDX6_THEOR|nr:Rab GTPase [Theileria orientalis strain Shintoku]PVC51344.1 Rab GTPase [Theileria orientalis]BAM41907.1 Rab GTPase [Theileria orientalis strain Shintoku]|eukprot:XP_009692208.1 Rab GTPase [Theileria orientalis strain Shintoku]